MQFKREKTLLLLNHFPIVCGLIVEILVIFQIGMLFFFNYQILTYERMMNEQNELILKNTEKYSYFEVF